MGFLLAAFTRSSLFRSFSFSLSSRRVEIEIKTRGKSSYFLPVIKYGLIRRLLTRNLSRRRVLRIRKEKWSEFDRSKDISTWIVERNKCVWKGNDEIVIKRCNIQEENSIEYKTRISNVFLTQGIIQSDYYIILILQFWFYSFSLVQNRTNFKR